MILLGSVPRAQLTSLLTEHVGEQARKEEARRRREAELDEIEYDDVSNVDETEKEPAKNQANVFARKRSVSDASLFHRIVAKKRHKYVKTAQLSEGLIILPIALI